MRTRHLDRGLVEVLDGPAQLRIEYHSCRLKSTHVNIWVRTRHLNRGLVEVLDGPARRVRAHEHERLVVAVQRAQQALPVALLVLQRPGRLHLPHRQLRLRAQSQFLGLEPNAYTLSLDP